jgi:hypothetical protein
MTQQLINADHASNFRFNIIEPRSSLHQQKISSNSDKQNYTTSQLLINDIINHAQYSLLKIAKETGIPLVSLRRLRSGRTKEPRSFAFDRIFSLYCKVCLSNQQRTK